MLEGCLFSGGPHPCVPCVRHFSGLGSCLLPSFASCPSPSYGTSGGGRSPICCGMVRAERQKGCSSPGNWWWQPCCPFWGSLGGTPMAAIASATAWLAIQDCGGLLRGEPEAHLFVGVQGRGRDEGLLQALPTSVAGIVVHDYYVVEV